MNDKQLLGSKIAKNGFRNEDDIINKFNEWNTDKEAKYWLKIMNYDLSEIEYVKAVKLRGFKTDIQVQITVKLKNSIDCQNIQVKLVSNINGFNQIDKRWVDKYTEMWNIPSNIVSILKRYTGEILPYTVTRDDRRMFADEFTIQEKNNIMEWLNENKILIVSDILKGRGEFAAEWILVAQKLDIQARWVLKPMNFCLNYFGKGPIEITKKGNFKIGNITMQRKGGDGGRDTAKMLQFKINPTELFNI